jgi:hypothetical protein
VNFFVGFSDRFDRRRRHDLARKPQYGRKAY